MACTEIWRSTIDPSLPTADAPNPLYQHEIDTGALLVAEHDGRVVGFAGSISRGARWFLADLFVSPDVQSTGTGRRLLDELVRRDRPGPIRATMASDDPRAIALYTSLGMSPRWPCFTLVGEPDGMTLSIDRPTRHAEHVDAESIFELSTRAGYALSLSDLIYWKEAAHAAFFVVGERGGAVVRRASGVSASHPDAIGIGPVFVERPDDLFDVVDAVLAEARASAPGGPIRLYVPGPSSALRPLLADGFQITDLDVHMSSFDHVKDPSMLDPTRVLPSFDLL